MHSATEQLADHLRHLIGNSPDQDISFYDYMQQCLYHPKFGYYQNDQSKIGKDGDFYTSSSIGNVMGIVLARLFAGTWSGSGPVAVVEWGGGTGRLARQVLDEWKASRPDMYRNVQWYSLEQSPFHRDRQRQELAEHIDRVTFCTTWPELPDQPFLFVLANELLDAFPVYRVKYDGHHCLEQRVYWDEQRSRFAGRWSSLASPRLIQHMETFSCSLKSGQVIEIRPDAQPWVHELGKHLHRGIALIIDYGDMEAELFSAHRMAGTLMCYYRHRAHDDPFILPGEQDITSHVNFTELIQAAKRSGFRTHYRSQKQFLLDEGVMNLLQDHAESDPFSEQSRTNRAVRQLLLSDGMSELFKVLMLEK